MRRRLILRRSRVPRMAFVVPALLVPAGTNSWRAGGTATVGRSDKFRGEARLRRSGRVVVKGLWPGGSNPSGGTGQSPDPGSGNEPTSGSREIDVAASLHLAKHATD